MADATVFCSMERLYDWEAPGEAVIGVTLSAAWAGSSAPPGRFLLPWRWLDWSVGPDKLQFYLACYATKDPTVLTISPIFAEALSRAGRRIADIRNSQVYQDFDQFGVGAKYQQIAGTLANLGYIKGGQDKISVAAAASDTSAPASSYGGGASWPSILADLSTRPAPIPHALLLSFIFRAGSIANLLPKPTSGPAPGPSDCSLIIAPRLTSKATGKNSDTDPVTDATAKPLNPGLDPASLLWSYSDKVYQASSQAVTLGPAPAAKTFFDLGSRLVLSPQGDKWHFSEDWQASFESRLAQRMDLSAELVRILEQPDPAHSDQTFTNHQARLLTDAAIAALRDVAGVGCDPLPGTGSVPQFDKSALEANMIADAATVAAIRSALPGTNFDTVDHWKSFLQQTFSTSETTLSDSYLANASIFGKDDISPADAVQQLNRLRQRVLQPDTLWALLQRQVLTLVPGALLTAPDLATLSAALRAENLGRHWKDLTQALSPPGPFSANAVRNSVAAKLQQRGNLRFQQNTILPPVSGEVASAVSDALSRPRSTSDWADAASYAIPAGAAPPPAAPGAATSTLASQGITLQINELGNSGNAPASETDDVRKMQGAGLLVGYDLKAANGTVSTSGYKCVNYADVCYLSTAGGVKVLEQAALVPARFTWRNGVAVSTVSYNNEPLPAVGPLSRAAKLISKGTADSEVKVDTDLLLYRYPTPRDPVHPDDKIAITALTFGRDYHPQPFLVSNAGAVPNRLATGFLDLKTGGGLDASTGIGATWATISYRRQRLPGALRLSNPAGTPQPHLKVPVIPDGVFPRAATGKDQPVIMLAPSDQARFTTDLPAGFDVNVKTPAADLITWDRFVNGFGNSLAASRVDVINGFLAAVKASGNQTDLSIDDPATVYTNYDCRLYYELFDEGSGTPAQADFVPFPPASGSGLKAVQAGLVSLHFTAASDNTGSKPPSIAVAGSDMKVTVFEGRIATLKLHVCVHKDFENRFSLGLLASAGSLQGDYYVLKSTDLTCEVVTSNLPDQATLFGNTKIGTFDNFDGTATVTLDPTGVPNSAYVYSAEVLRQVWKWQGRPVTPLPTTGSVTKEWMTREFGTRSESDFLRVPMLPPAPDAASKVYSFVEQRGSLLADAQRAVGKLPATVASVAVPAESRLLGTFIRYGVQVESRYKPLLVQNSYVTAKRADGELWNSLYIPSRKLTQIKPPDVKIVLPLTRYPDDSDGPGLLVMLRGPWFSECGLGERLEAQIVMVESPGEDPNTTSPRTFYYQYGSDPVLTNPTKLKPVQEGKNETGWGDETKTINGPVGHTFDTVASGQLFVNTSFVLSYPKVGGAVGKPWSFCKLQVRRVVDVIGVGQKAGVSDWSPPTWVQLLPDFDLYSAVSQFKSLTLNYENSGNFQLLSGNQPVTLTAGNGDSIYANYLAVTHFVADVTGTPVQEAYDGLYRQSGAEWIPIGAAPAAPNDPQTFFRARVLTVQGKLSSVTSEDDFWNDVFTIDPGAVGGALVSDSARLRIVGVSRPIDIVRPGVSPSLYKGC